MAVEIRQGDAAFAAVLAAIHERSFADPWPEESLRQLLAQPAVTCLLASEGEVPCAFLLYQSAGGEAEILTLAVLPAFRRHGIAAALVEALKQRMRAAKGRRLLLEVAADNRAARALYDRCGFLPIATRRAYYRAGGGKVDAIVMACDL